MKFNNHWADYARYLPAPNDHFVKFAAQSATNALNSRLPNGVLARHTNFLNPTSPLFCWPDVLFTATFGVGTGKPTIISKRDRTNTFVLGDSGGFSLISGAISASMGSWREATLDWQEAECDVGIIVDVPTRAIDVPASGYTNFQQCLDQTIDNAEFAIANRSRSDLKLLAVYQGRTKAEADNWAKVMETYQPRFDGMAIAGHTRLEIADWIRRFRSMMDRGLFGTVSHIHFLGTSQPRFAVLATALQRALRKHIRPDLNVTFDSSTSFTFAQKFGQIVTGLQSDRKDMRMTNHIMPNRGGEFNRSTPFPYRSPLADLCTVSDFLPGTDPTKNPSDVVGNNMLSHHSVYAELSAILQANRLVDLAQEGKNGMVPYEITLAIDLIDKAIGGSDRGLVSLQQLLNRGGNKIVAAVEDRADEV
ncbi:MULTISPECIES: hypothetical protein [unclassified Rhizobium]|uniref:hypothetical protein n=1 Tax=unclassified Rhizobium TaxID=2613769 RepID=UPI001AE9FDF7|nr:MULTISPECIES: hypothetical protein [unclassified Rhizobium]MBP2461836.1 hypothetical protein [Rhizobium sp. PvP014]MBP2529231.1 hypothetical protein [Rhizobium sp. PvP099]